MSQRAVLRRLHLSVNKRNDAFRRSPSLTEQPIYREITDKTHDPLRWSGGGGVNLVMVPGAVEHRHQTSRFLIAVKS